MLLMTTSLLINIASGGLVAALLGFGMARVAKLGASPSVAVTTAPASPLLRGEAPSRLTRFDLGARAGTA